MSTPVDPRRSLPAVNGLIEAATADGDWPNHVRVAEAARAVLDAWRDRLTLESAPPSLDDLVAEVRGRLDHAERTRFRAVINGTGIILHTGLGRAPLPTDAAARVHEVASGYAPVEFDLASGRRGHRSDLVRESLCRLTGAESATAVNNNAAALMLILSTLARGREVIVSRGQLIEIGGSFRLPDIMEASGCRLREVGTTNKTRPDDYVRAITADTAAILRVHPSNYRVEGFARSVDIDALVAIGRRAGVPVIDDVGSGLLDTIPGMTMPGEPRVRAGVAAGADLVLFSGDKLLGGPQSGLIVGRSDLVARVERNPMARAMRLDKLVLAALVETLACHEDATTAIDRVPVLRMLTTSIDALRSRAWNIVAQMADAGCRALTVESSAAYSGGGAMPAQSIESVAVRIDAGSDADGLARRLRLGSPAVVGRTHDGAVWIDLRTVDPATDEALIDAIGAAMGVD